MRTAFFIFLLAAALLFACPGECLAKEIRLFSFEDGPQGWSIPDWAYSKQDNVGEEVSISEFFASEGNRSFELKVGFPGASDWQGAYVECPIGVTDWTPYNWLSVDVYLPEDATRSLRARIVLTVGDEWLWTESNKAVRLVPGEWTVVRVKLTPDSLDWRRFIMDKFRGDVKKLGVRIESSGAEYEGSVYLDNVRLSE
ncbi:hypothetical protein ACFL3N_01585 [Candidatus Omnitrophota bacterium]